MILSANLRPSARMLCTNLQRLTDKQERKKREDTNALPLLFELIYLKSVVGSMPEASR